MNPRRKSKTRFIWYLLVAVIIVLAYWESPNVIPTPVPPTPTPVVLSQEAQGVSPEVLIGHQTKTIGCKSDGVLPDRECTPGAIDPNVTEKLTGGTICISGYSSEVRPSTSKTNKIKQAQLLAYGFSGPMSDYELDHLISLELGGCPDCVANLWPEPYNMSMGARAKDKVENYLHKQVCAGVMTLKEAQYEIATDWTAVYYRVYGK